MQKLNMYEMNNGMVMTFDEAGRQVPTLQGTKADVARTLAGVRGVEIQLYDAQSFKGGQLLPSMTIDLARGTHALIC
jgi:hypothetical protein